MNDWNPQAWGEYLRSKQGPQWITVGVPQPPERYLYFATHQTVHGCTLERRIGRSRDLLTYYEEGSRVLNAHQVQALS